MKICRLCRLEKPEEEFKLTSRGDRLYRRNACKKCEQDLAKIHRSQSPEYGESQLRRNRSYKERNRKILEDFKRGKPCADCGQIYPPWVMDLDHVRGRKVAGCSALAQRTISARALLAEIAKCEAVCANCHRQRTHDREAGHQSSVHGERSPEVAGPSHSGRLPCVGVDPASSRAGVQGAVTSGCSGDPGLPGVSPEACLGGGGPSS